MQPKFKDYRKALGLRQQDVADKLGISRGAYSHYEKGIREPNLDLLIKMADVFRTTVDDLLGHNGGRDSLKAWELTVLDKLNSLDDDALTRVITSLANECQKQSR